MMSLQWLMNWWNLIFAAPLAVALLYLGVYTLTGITFGDADVDADVDADADAHLDADADVDADGDADAESDADADHDSDADDASGGHASLHALALSWLGVGRVPLSLVMMVLMLTWGAAGLATNVVMRDRAATDWAAARVSLPVALLVSLGFTRAMVMLVGRFLPANETSARPRRALLGCTGEAIFAINESFGMAAVRDDAGDLHQVPCRTAAGIGPIPKGARVTLVAYREGDRVFFVAAAEPPAPRPPREPDAARPTT